MPHFALIGKKLGHSWSKQWFDEKFSTPAFNDHTYQNLEIESIDHIRSLVNDKKLSGFNITIPYKSAILPYLDHCSEEGLQIGAVNVVKVQADGSLWGYNTDVIGFEASLTPLLKNLPAAALIFGTGGASKAVQFVLHKKGIPYQLVSTHGDGLTALSYSALTEEIMHAHHLLINTTPLGMFPDITSFPDIPYQRIGPSHLVVDLVYNPPETEFLKKAKRQGAHIKNGVEMLRIQAESALSIWMQEG